MSSHRRSADRADSADREYGDTLRVGWRKVRLSALVREAIRNITSGTTRFALFGVVLSALTAGLILADFFVVVQQLDSAKAFRASGASTVTLAAKGQIDGTACHELSRISGVRAAGAVRQSSQKITPTLLSMAPLPEFEVTERFPSILSAAPEQGAGLILSREVATALGAGPGDVLNTAEGSFPVKATYDYPADGRRPGFGYAALSVAHDRRPFDECWVDAWPQITNLRALMFLTLEPGESDPDNRPTISQLNSSQGETFRGHELFSSRVTRGAMPLAFALSVAVGFVSTRMRRLQLASALHAGVLKRDLVFLVTIETAAWALSATVIGLGMAAVSARLVPQSDSEALLAGQIPIALIGLFGAVTGALAAGLLAREKHLFRYFKGR